jgi:hypothetical protein
LINFSFFEFPLFSNRNGQNKLTRNATIPTMYNLSVSNVNTFLLWTHRQATIVTKSTIKCDIGNLFIALIQFQKIEDSFVFMITKLSTKNFIIIQKYYFYTQKIQVV